MQHIDRLLRLGVMLIATTAASASEPDAIGAVQVLREGGCGGLVPAAPPLHHASDLDHAAAQWANGSLIAAAVRENGYEAEALSGLKVSGPESALVQLLRRTGCRTITDRSLQDLGVYHRGRETWFLLSSRAVQSIPGAATVGAAAPPMPMLAPALAVRALQLVNDVRARGTRCGKRAFGPAPAVRLSGPLNEAALGHAADMARHDYFEHADLAGRTPAERVQAVGYREKLVGENIAYGPESTDEVVQGWLDSPAHCENMMDPRFVEMGIAYSPGHALHRGLYWVQLLAAPKT